MSDVRCLVCGEPWDYWGARHGEMKVWEWQLFARGAGCPCCEGQDPEGGQFQPERLSDIEFGDLDPGMRLEGIPADQRPPWRAPEPVVHWTCAACGVRVVTDPDSMLTDGSGHTGGEPEYDLPAGAPGSQWYHSHPYDRGTPETEPAHTFYAGTPQAAPVCEFCLDHCEHCGAAVCSGLDCADVYSEGYCAQLEGWDQDDLFCIECIVAQCEGCGQIGPDDCTCLEDTARAIERLVWERTIGDVPEGWDDKLASEWRESHEGTEPPESWCIERLKAHGWFDPATAEESEVDS
jgi:hypothetical protein